jgi:hypothetical protein
MSNSVLAALGYTNSGGQLNRAAYFYRSRGRLLPPAAIAAALALAAAWYE